MLNVTGVFASWINYVDEWKYYADLQGFIFPVSPFIVNVYTAWSSRAFAQPG